MDMMVIPSEFFEYHSEFILRTKSRACKKWFMDCLGTFTLDSDDWLEQKAAEFNWWMSGLNADKSGPGSLDARLRLRSDVRDVLVDVLNSLEIALSKLYQIATSGPLLFGEKPIDPANNIRPPSPWSDMSNSSKTNSNLSSPREEGLDQEADNNAFLGSDEYREQRVYINTNLAILIRIYTAIKLSGLKFRNHYADDSLKRAEEEFQSEKDLLGEHQALCGQNGEHERFRRYLTRLVLWNGYTQNFLHRLGYRIDKLAETRTPQDKQYSDFLLQKKLLIVFRTYFYDAARLTTIQRRLINANVIRRNRLIHAGTATKASFGVQQEHQAQPPKNIVQQVLRMNQTRLVAQPITPVKPNEAEDQEDKPSKSFVARPATALESRFSITGALPPPRVNKSTATKMSATVAHLDYPKCPATRGQFPCPYCPIILTEEYTKKEKWRGHVAQDICAYICVFEDCESPDEMFASTYEWMSHMARFHSETDWVCHKCAQDPALGVQGTSIFKNPALLREHILASHPFLDHSELTLVVDAGKQTAGIQKVKCPLCRPGLVSLEEDGEDGEDDNMGPPPTGHEIGLIQLEDDEHIATHIHEFALHSFPFLKEGTSESSQSLSDSHSSTRAEITFQGSQNLETSYTNSSPLYNWSEVAVMLGNLRAEILGLCCDQGHNAQRFIAILQNLVDTSQVEDKDLEESVDIDAFTSALNESRSTISQFRDMHAGHDTEELLLNQLFDNLDRSSEVLRQALRLVETSKTARMRHYYIPVSMNPQFIGHDTILYNLYEKLLVQNQWRKAALLGVGGIGKTQIALKFAYLVMEKRPEYSIFWIPMGLREEPEQTYMAIAKQLGIQKSSNDDEVERLVCQHIRSDKAGKYLFIMDDASILFRYGQRRSIREYVPESANCLILFTTRNGQIAADFAQSNAIEVGPMDNEAVGLLEPVMGKKQMMPKVAESDSGTSTTATHPPLSRQSSHSSLSRQWSSQSFQHSSSYDYDPTEAGLYEYLRSKLIECDRTGKTQDFSRFSFIPLDALDEVVTTETVKLHTGNHGWRSWPRDDSNGNPSKIVNRAKKLFAILGLIEEPSLISILAEEGIEDEDLPLIRPAAAKQSKILVSSRGTKFKSFSKLKSRDIDEFLRRQWYVLAPVFPALGGGIGVDRDICIYKDTPLPFFNIKKISSVPGRNTLYRGRLHAAHINPRPINDVEIAIKNYTKKDDFDKEKSNLTIIQGLNNPYLIQHISTIQQDNLYYIIFPWANGGNLSDFWQAYTSSPQLHTWSLCQMLGLADALSDLHYKLGGHKLDGMHYRHGDLKPENILHFRSSHDSTYGTLVIADVGMSKVHYLADLLHDPIDTKATTSCYEAPEGENNDKRPRRYDMWSLGCIFMEFVIWLLDGYGAIEEFKKQLRDDDPFPQKAVFSMRSASRPAIVHPAVSERLRVLRNDPRCPPGSPLASLVNLIDKDLIVVDPEKRVNAGELRDRLRKIVHQKTEKDPG